MKEASPLFLIFLLLVGLSCEKEMMLPIDEDKLIDIIYDKTLAEAALVQSPDAVRDSLYTVYENQILVAHGVTRGEYEASVAYLMNNLEYYIEIQETVMDSIKKTMELQ